MSLIENIANNIKVLHKVKSVPTNTSKLGIHLVEGGGVYIVAKDPVTPTLKVVKKIYESSDYYMKGSVDTMLSAQKQLLDDADAILQSQVTAVQQTTATHTAEIQNIKDEYVANKGYYNSLVTLQSAYPTPEAGDIAYVANVASTTGYYIYNVVGGAWTASTVEAPPVSVPIANYAEHGYTGTPKTLKTVEDEKASEIAQLAGTYQQKELFQGVPYIPTYSVSVHTGVIDISKYSQIKISLNNYVDFKFRFIGSDTTSPTSALPASDYFQAETVCVDSAVLAKPYIWIQVLRVDGGNVVPTDIQCFQFITIPEKIDELEDIASPLAGEVATIREELPIGSAYPSALSLAQGVPYNAAITTSVYSDILTKADFEEIKIGLNDYVNFKFRFIGSDTTSPTTTLPASAYFQAETVLTDVAVLAKPYIWVQILRVDGAALTPDDVECSLIVDVKKGLSLISEFIRENGENSGSIETVYVDKATGSDGNDGVSLPVSTIGKAISLLGSVRKGKIIVAEGDYRETLNLSNLTKNDLSIIGKINHTVRIMGSTQITGWTLTSGKTNVFETAFTGTINATKPIIFEDGRESIQILPAQRHALQKSNTHRLPYTKISAIAFNTDLATTLNDLESTPGRFYHDVAGNKLYIHSSDSDNPLSNGYSYEYSVRTAITPPSIGGVSELGLQNISFFFSNDYGLNVYSFGRVYRQFVTVMGSVENGIQDSSSFVISHNDEVADCRDGLAGTHAITDNNRERPNITYIAPWSHDNSDDGTSHHSKSNVKTMIGLFEYNGKSGIAPSNSSQWVDHNSICRNNKSAAHPNYGEGVEGVNAILAGDSAIGCTFTGYGTICEGNRVGFGARNAATVSMNLYGCISRNNDDAEYLADAGIIHAYNCKATNADPLKLKVVSGTGEINVTNDDQLI